MKISLTGSLDVLCRVAPAIGGLFQEAFSSPSSIFCEGPVTAYCALRRPKTIVGKNDKQAIMLFISITNLAK